MQAAFGHALMLVFAAAIAWLGWFMAHDPERASRLFTFGSEPAFGKRFVLSWSRGVGWFFTAGGCLGSALYLVLITIDLFY
jgi:hypothetical protein